MPTPSKKRDTGCPIVFSLDLYGDRWSLLIIRDMMFKGATSYGEFLTIHEKFATNILADRLRQLETDGIIEKMKDPENGRKNIYRLTPKGLDLAPVILEMIRWGMHYDPNTGLPETLLQRIETDRESFLEDIRNRNLR